MTDTHRVVVVGGGFGGLQAARTLARTPSEVTLVDRRNFHLLQPLTYRGATRALSPGDITYPLRAIFKHGHNVRVELAEGAEGADFDLGAREVRLRARHRLTHRARRSAITASSAELRRSRYWVRLCRT